MVAVGGFSIMSLGINFGMSASGLSSLKNITGNAEFVFGVSGVSFVLVHNISTTKAIIVYTDLSDGFEKAQILDISGGTITGNTPFTFATSGTPLGLSVLSESKAIVMYGPSAQILDISGGTITGNTSFLFHGTSGVFNGTLEKINSSSVIVEYQNISSSTNFVQILDISGTVITGNAPFEYGSPNDNRGTSLQTIDSSKAIISYIPFGAGDLGVAQILDISSGTITGNTPFTFSSVFVTETPGTSLSILNQFQAIVSYVDSIGGSGFAQVLDISGAAITGNSEFIFATGSILEANIKTSGSSAIITYVDSSVSSFGESQMLNIINKNITGNTIFTYEPSFAVSVTDLTLLNNTTALVVYKNPTNGASQILDIL